MNHLDVIPGLTGNPGALANQQLGQHGFPAKPAPDSISGGERRIDAAPPKIRYGTSASTPSLHAMTKPGAHGDPPTDQNLREPLVQGATALGLDLRGGQIDALLAYLALIQKWNQVYNLTAVREPQDMLTQHILDSLAVLPSLRRHAPMAKRLLDVGSGAGLPGVVLAIANPNLQVTCLDAVAKKAAFIAQVAGSLGLLNLQSLHARVEALMPEAGQAWELICSRAFSSLTDFVVGSQNALAPGGLWMAMKGKPPQDEIGALPADVEVFHVEQIQVPQLDVQRCLVWMRRR